MEVKRKAWIANLLSLHVPKDLTNLIFDYLPCEMWKDLQSMVNECKGHYVIFSAREEFWVKKKCIPTFCLDRCRAMGSASCANCGTERGMWQIVCDLGCSHSSPPFLIQIGAMFLIPLRYLSNASWVFIQGLVFLYSPKYRSLDLWWPTFPTRSSVHRFWTWMFEKIVFLYKL